jgi:cobalt-zinc-cadmium resistance protein CzcA
MPSSTFLPGYSITYGGQFENLQHATARLMIAVPVALLLILFLLYLAFDSMREALVIFAAVPLAAVGGILALELRGLPFSISAGIGFIALFGVAVLNGLVLVNEFIRLRGRDGLDLKGLIEEGARARLRPVLTTALVASLGFLPMAISTTNGAEVQRPLATVVIGGLVTSTLLTLVVLPAIYFLVEKRRYIRLKGGAVVALLLLFLGFSIPTQAQESLGLDELVQSARTNRVEVISAGLQQQHWQQERKMSYTLPDLTMGVQYGQINYEKADYNANVHQDLGKPWTAGTHKRWADAGAAQAAKQGELAMHDVTFQVRSCLLPLAVCQGGIGRDGFHPCRAEAVDHGRRDAAHRRRDQQPRPSEHPQPHHQFPRTGAELPFAEPKCGAEPALLVGHRAGEGHPRHGVPSLDASGGE